MKKVPTLFVRDESDRSKVTAEVNPKCLWVFKGEGVAHQKIDGTSVLVDDDGAVWKRRALKPDAKIPAEFAEAEFDPITGKRFGWMPVTSEDRWNWEATVDLAFPSGTYELIGPKVQGNPEGAYVHTLVSHASTQVLDAPRTFGGLREWLADKDIEGIVWHHPDGRMAKIKKRDFGLPRKPKATGGDS